MSVQIKKAAKPASAKSAPAQESSLTVIAKVIKGDTYMVMAESAKELDDEYESAGLYQGNTMSTAVVPPYNPKTLKNLVIQNNILNQCVHAMEVNIDGTGHEFVSAVEDEEMDPTELEAAKQFFDEPYPGRSFILMRRDLRRDLESMGWGALEVLQTMDRTPVAVRYVDGQSLRMARLGAPVELKRMIMRGGREVELTVTERPRRYLQLVNGLTKQYFKEFGVPLDLNRKTGEWAKPGEQLPPDVRATELLVFGVDKDVTTPYWVPRWINQLPSVVGSRKAEESNLEFFDAGGMPPAIIFVQGGKLTGPAADQLRTYLSSGNKKRGRAVVVELESTSGDINSGGSVTAKVERFGAERANDSMYMSYDTAAEEHVRTGFRLPPMFIGKASDYNFATAVVSYQVAEAQVFGPERSEFDEVVNKTLIKALGWKTLKFKSLPITLKSVDETFKGLTLLDGKVNPEELVAEINKVIGTNLTYVEPPEPEPPVQGKIDPLTGLPYDKPVQPLPMPVPGLPAPEPKAQPIKRLEVLQMVRKAAIQRGLVDGELTDAEAQDLADKSQRLTPEQQQLFKAALATFSAPEIEHRH